MEPPALRAAPSATVAPPRGTEPFGRSTVKLRLAAPARRALSKVRPKRVSRVADWGLLVWGSSPAWHTAPPPAAAAAARGGRRSSRGPHPPPEIERRWRAGAEQMQSRCRADGEEMERRWRGGGEEMERRWRGGGEEIERRWRGVGEVERRWRGDGEKVQRRSRGGAEESMALPPCGEREELHRLQS